MPRSSRPRKAHRPKPIGRPVMEPMRRDLVLPCYAALTVLQSGSDRDAVESARHTLAAALDYLLMSVDEPKLPPIIDGLHAIRSMDERHKRTGTLRPTGQELQALRLAVIACDEALPTLRTNHLIDGQERARRALKG